MGGSGRICVYVDIKVFKRRYALTMCVNASHTNKQTFNGGRRKSKMIYSREKILNCGVVFGLWIRFDKWIWR